MKIIKFADVKNKIEESLEGKLNVSSFPGEHSGFTLADGFINSPISSELSGTVVIGGPTIPMIAIVGNTTGRVYFFALKVLIPDIEEG